MNEYKEKGDGGERMTLPYGKETEDILKKLPETLDKLGEEDIVSFGERLGKEYAKYKDENVEYGIVVGTYFDKRKGKKMPKLSEIKTNQIRNVFQEIKRIETMWRREPQKKEGNEIDFTKIERELILLKPKLAYAARHDEVKPLKKVLTKSIDAVVKAGDKRTAFENFIRFVESIVAYHKYYGGK